MSAIAITTQNHREPYTRVSPLILAANNTTCVDAKVAGAAHSSHSQHPKGGMRDTYLPLHKKTWAARSRLDPGCLSVNGSRRSMQVRANHEPRLLSTSAHHPDVNGCKPASHSPLPPSPSAPPWTKAGCLAWQDSGHNVITRFLNIFSSSIAPLSFLKHGNC